MALARLSSLVKRATQLTTTPFHSLAISTQPHHLTAQSHLTTSFPPTGRQALQTHFFSTTSEKRNIQDHKRRLLAAKYELRRKLYKSLSKDPELSTEMRAKHRYKLSKLPRNSSFVRLRNRPKKSPVDLTVFVKWHMFCGTC
ncbi:hypothetical protein ACET3Z_014957 [Daucus carota]